MSTTSHAPLAHLQSHLSEGSNVSFNESDNDLDDSINNVFEETERIHDIIARESWYQTPLVVVVVGASGDLAKKKTYPSLFELFENDLLPKDTIIWGYARSSKTHEGLRNHLRPYLTTPHTCHRTLEQFLSLCYYHSGSSYGDQDAYTQLMNKVKTEFFDIDPKMKVSPNILYYLAIPPNVFGETINTLEKVPNAVSIETTKFIIEKPFGRDTKSCKELLSSFEHLPEHMIYRIDHYLGKPLVDNIVTLRQANPFLEYLWNNQCIQSVHIKFKEPFGTHGRGGYFDHYGIIRDVVQNHLLQVLLLVAIELPVLEEFVMNGNKSDSGDSIRQAKVQVLQNMPPITLDDALLGQYIGYTDDDTIKNKNTVSPTYVACRCFVNTNRWKGVPFIMEAGKALDEGLVQIEIQFKNHRYYPSNVLKIRVQPNPSVSLTTNMKPLSLVTLSNNQVMSTSMVTNYPQNGDDGSRNNQENKHDGGEHHQQQQQHHNAMMIENAYTRLLMDALRGKQANFCRDDELIYSWEIFTPLLEQIERDQIKPEPYKEGTVGPDNRGIFLDRMGIVSEAKPLSAL